MGFELPARSSVGYLDVEVANEGEKVILSDGNVVQWSPPPAKPVMPDWSGIKSIRHYFNRTGHEVWPAWFYHPTEPAKIMKNAKEAKQELGIFYRQATVEERGRYGLTAVWDWDEGCLWRSQPYAPPKFDPANPGQGKSYISTPPNPVIAQNAMIEALIPVVTAAVVTALKSGGAPSAPANIEAGQWDEFLQFQAWKKTQEAVASITNPEPEEHPSAEPETMTEANALSADERTLWADEAKRKGIKVDGRWSLDRLKSEVEKAD